jgi:hypothetical protein
MIPVSLCSSIANYCEKIMAALSVDILFDTAVRIQLT